MSYVRCPEMATFIVLYYSKSLFFCSELSMRPLLITGYVGPYYILQLHQTGFSKWKCKTVHFLPQSANINLLRHKETQRGHIL